MLPKEHGSWAVLLGPILVGLAAGGLTDPAAAAAFLLAAFGGFLARRPLISLLSLRPEPAARRWLTLYGVIGLVAGGWLAMARGRWELASFAVPALAALATDAAFRRAGRPLHAANETIGIAALCLGAPAACFAVTGRAPASVWCAWGLCVLHFVGPVFHVKLAALRHRALADPTARERLPAARARNLVYHGLALAVATGLTVAGVVAPWVLAPFTLALHKAWSRGLAEPGKVDFRALGYGEVAYAGVLVLALVAARS